VTAGQTLDLEAKLSQSLLRKVDLPVLKGIFLATSNEERKSSAISRKETTEVEPFGLCFVISREASRGREVEPTIMAVYGVVELANLRVRYLIAFRPHHACQHLERDEGACQSSARPVGKAAQYRRGEPRVRVSAWEKSAIKDEDTADFRRAPKGAPVGPLKTPPKGLHDDERGKVDRYQHCRLNSKMALDRFDKIRPLGGGIRVVLGLVAVAHAYVLDEKL